jgi:GAF domain-containing protein
MREPLARDADDSARRARYDDVLRSIAGLLDGERDWIAALATVACELHGSFAYFDWTGFYRAVRPDVLVVGPYQGGHGCLRIESGRGVCGAAATSGRTQRVDDVEAFPGHIACSNSTRSEIVVPVCTPDGRLLGVLDIDSDAPAAFRAVDQDALETLCARLGAQFADVSAP